MHLGLMAMVTAIAGAANVSLANLHLYASLAISSAPVDSNH